MLARACRFESGGAHQFPKCSSRPWLELEYTLRSKRSAFGRAGSSPAGRTNFLRIVSSIGQSIRFLPGRLKVRLLHGPPFSRRVRSSKVEHPAFNRTGRVRCPPSSPLLGLRLAAGHRALNARTQVRILEPQPPFRRHVNSAARVLACLARSHGFESRTWRHVQRTDSSVGRAPG